MAEPTDKDARGATNLKIKFRSANLDEFIERYAVDVSKGGIFIRTREPLSVNTRLNLDFQLLEAAPLLQGEGTVVWIRQPDAARAEVTPGMGVRFDKLTPDSQQRLDKILEEKERLAQSGKGAGASAAASAAARSAGGIAVRRPTGAFLPTDALAAKPPGSEPGAGAAPKEADPKPRRTTAPNATLGAGFGSQSSGGADAGKPAPVRQSPFLAGRARNTGPLGTFRGGAAQNFEPPTADDIDRALSVLEEKPGPVPAMPPPPRLSPHAPVHVTDDGSNEPTRVVADPQEFGVHEAVTGRADVLPETGLPDAAVPELKEIGTEDMTSKAPLSEEATIAASPAAFAAAERSIGGTPSRPPGLDTPLGVLEPDAEDSVPVSKSIASGIVIKPSAPASASPEMSGRFRTNATYRRPRTTEKKVAVVVVLLAIAGAGFAFRHQLAGLMPKSEVAQLPVTPEPPTPQPSAAVDGAAATEPVADAGAAAQPAMGGTPPIEAKPALAKTDKPEPKPEAKPEDKPAPRPATPTAKRKPLARPAASGAIEVAPPPSEKPVAVAAEATPPGEAKPGDAKPGDAKPTEAKPPGDAPAPPTPEAPAAPAVAPLLRIASVPNGARVLLDGVPVGSTPLSIKDIDPNADHAVSVQKEGFEPQERQFGPTSWTRSKGSVSLKMNIKLRRAGAPAPAPGQPAEPKEGGKPSDVEIITPDS